MRDDISRKKRTNLSTKLAESMVAMASVAHAEAKQLSPGELSDPLGIVSRATDAGMTHVPLAFNGALATMGTGYGLLFRSPMFQRSPEGEGERERCPHEAALRTFLAPAFAPPDPQIVGCPIADAGLYLVAAARDILRTSCTCTDEAMQVVSEMFEIMIEAIHLGCGMPHE